MSHPGAHLEDVPLSSLSHLFYHHSLFSLSALSACFSSFCYPSILLHQSLSQFSLSFLSLCPSFCSFSFSLLSFSKLSYIEFPFSLASPCFSISLLCLFHSCVLHSVYGYLTVRNNNSPPHSFVTAIPRSPISLSVLSSLYL